MYSATNATKVVKNKIPISVPLPPKPQNGEHEELWGFRPQLAEVHWRRCVNFRAHVSQSSAMHAWAAINVTCP